MPRKLRVQVADVVYHVGSRGVEKRPIFDVVPGDRVFFLVLLERTIERYGWFCHAYCLMGNHFHLVVETPMANIAAGMQYLKGSYAIWLNEQIGREGALFERRYFDEIVESESYAYELMRYVVLNPVRARLCPHPRDWRWSNHQAHVGMISRPRFLHSGRLHELFGEGERGIALYEQFVEDGVALLRRGFSA